MTNLIDWFDPISLATEIKYQIKKVTVRNGENMAGHIFFPLIEGI